MSITGNNGNRAADLPRARTAAVRPDLFNEPGASRIGRRLLIALVAVLTILGLGLRIHALSSEGLSEDEYNKLSAVADYRAHGLTTANGEHPLLMKAVLTVSVVAAEKWNAWLHSAGQDSGFHIPVETALRLPGVIVGGLTSVLIYLVAASLFGAEAGLIAAALWACDPIAIGFNRIAKEDTFLVFFFLLANVFWLKSQRIAETEPERRPHPFYWATAAAYGAMVASKYVPQLIGVSVAYYWMFQGIPATRWRLGRARFLLFFVVVGLVFLICSPTILLPGALQQMRSFASGSRIGHDSLEFMGRLYPHQLALWLRGVPWYFYLVFMAVKLPLLTLCAFVIGLPALFRRRTGDGRYFLLFWMMIWMLTFTWAGGKFTRYFTSVLPAVLMTASIGIQIVARRLATQCAQAFSDPRAPVFARFAIAALVVFASVRASVTAAPHFRLYMNVLGGSSHAGEFFPHDEFYDSSLRWIMTEIARQARPNARVASETPALAEYYARVAGRPDIISLSLSDSNAVKSLEAGDFVIDERGRRYYSNMGVLETLERTSSPLFTARLGDRPSAAVYRLEGPVAERR